MQISQMLLLAAFIPLLLSCNDEPASYSPPVAGVRRVKPPATRPVVNTPCKCCSTDSEKLLVVFPRLGFGNRVQVLAAAKLWAQKTNRRLILEWLPQEKHMPATFSDLFVNHFDSLDDVFGLRAECSREFILNGGDGYEQGLTRYRMRAAGTLSPSIETLLDDRSDVVVIDSYARFVSPTFPNADFKRGIVEFYKSLVPRAAIDERAKSWQLPNCNLAIGIHYRSFSTKADTSQSRNPTLENFMEDLQLHMSDAIEMPPLGNGACFFVASDSRTAQREIVRKLSGLFPRARFTGPNPTEQVERDNVAQQQAAVSEWLAMARSDVLFGSNESTFSDEAGRLTRLGRKISVGEKAYGDHVNNLDPL